MVASIKRFICMTHAGGHEMTIKSPHKVLRVADRDEMLSPQLAVIIHKRILAPTFSPVEHNGNIALLAGMLNPVCELTHKPRRKFLVPSANDVMQMRQVQLATPNPWFNAEAFPQIQDVGV